MVNNPDQVLFGSLKNGSDAAFKKVYNENRPLFLNFAKKYGVDNEDILDIYQDAYIAFYENVQSGKLAELRSSISTYLIGIGKYMLLDRLRKNKKNIKKESVLEVLPEADLQLESFDIVKNELSVEQQLLQKYFDRLAAKCKAILTLFYYKSYSIKQIMEEGGYSSENVVKSQKSRCLKTLKESIKKIP